MDKNLEFKNKNRKKITQMFNDKKLRETTKKWFLQTYEYEYSYHFSWLGRPIIQYPQDMISTFSETHLKNIIMISQNVVSFGESQSLWIYL